MTILPGATVNTPITSGTSIPWTQEFSVPLELCWQKGKQLTVAALNKLGQFFPGTECEFDTDGEGSFSFTIKDDGKETYVEILTRDDGEEEDEDDDWGDEEEEWEDPEDEYPDYRGYGEEDY